MNVQIILFLMKLPLFVFCFIIAAALCSGVHGFNCAKAEIESDINNALSITRAEMPCDAVSADTIRCYRGHLTIAALKETAGIAVRTVRRDGRWETVWAAEANCGFGAVLMMSDQRAAGTLLCAGVLWLLGCMWWHRLRRRRPAGLVLTYGGIAYCEGQFSTVTGKPIKLTPMQYTLLKMFFQSDSHTLSKQEICQRLWPKKPDASDTLYTLIRRIKPVIEANSNLKIECDRNKSYSLINNDLQV